MVKAFPLKLFIKEGSGDGFKQYKGASTHPQVFCDKYESAEIMQSLFALFSFPSFPLFEHLKRGAIWKAKTARSQIKSKVLIHAQHKHAYRIETSKYLTLFHADVL